MDEGRIYIDRDWKFCERFSEEMLSPQYDDSGMQTVMIPHSVCETPFHYFDEHIYQMVSCYRKHFFPPKEWQGLKMILTFEGVAHAAEVYVNGARVAESRCGYTAFSADITDQLKYGEDNVITVKVNSNEDIDQPPFGFAIDYMTYGGIYRDVYVMVKPQTYIERCSISTKLIDRYEKDGIRFCSKGAALSKIFLCGQVSSHTIRTYIRKKGEGEFALMSTTPATEGYTETVARVNDVELWDPENPALYEQRTELVDEKGNVTDVRTDVFGFRKAVFKTNGFYINGRKFKIRGLNRHQSYAYTGYAMPDSMQKLDAEILKGELGVNAVRTSHYPQAQSFLDRCDELGLLVFTEIPGWQHIGGDEWKDIAVDNVKNMIRQNINHPSIILWGVRINESVDDEEFYARTNAVAHAEDPDRQTGGVRCYKKGIFQEDVYTYNDFSHCGDNEGVLKKSSVTADGSKPYLITEYNGHMFPTKAFDCEDHRLEHLLRHTRVLDGVAAADDISGSFGWCMFDYNTHKDFGSGDRICYHGVCDMFRNPKLAASVYAAQQDEVPVLEISSSMDIGEHPGGNIGKVYIISNADCVRMYKNGSLIREYTGADSEFGSLGHGPIKITDYIGDEFIVSEGMPEKKAREIKDFINGIAENGIYRISPVQMAKAGILCAKYRMSKDELIGLYGKYIANWGGIVSTYRFEAIKDGKIVKTVVISSTTESYIEAFANTDTLREQKTYDVALVRIRAVDQNGNLLSFYNDPVRLEADGSISIIGPDTVALSGGMGGTYVRSTGAGRGTLKVTDNRGKTVSLYFTVK